MIGLDPTTVAAAAPRMAIGLGKSWPEDRTAVLAGLNKFRNWVYNNYPNNNLFSEVFHCLCVNCYSDPCGTDCSTGSTYQGFTLPQDVSSVEAVYQSGDSAILRTRWREPLTGLGDHGVRLEVKEMPQLFPTERDLRGTSRLKMFAESAEDDGKVVKVECRMLGGKTQTLTFVLKGDSWVVCKEYVVEILSVALPLGRKGGVRIADQENYELSIYDPVEVVPAYRRFKITGSCCPESVRVQGVKRFRDIWWDHDIVEVGDGLVLEAAGRFFRYGEGTTDASEIARSRVDEQTMRDNIAGLIARHRGNSVMDGPKTRRCTRRTTLPGYGRRR